MSLETYTAAVTRGVQPQFSSASAFYEATSHGKQILSAILEEVNGAHCDYLAIRNTTSEDTWRKKKLLLSLLSEQKFTHYRDPDTVALFYHNLVALPFAEWEKYLKTAIFMDDRRLARIRKVLVDLISLSVGSALKNHPPAYAGVKKLFKDCEEKEAIQVSLKTELYQDPLIFTKGRGFVIHTIASYSSWGTSLTTDEKVTCSAPELHCAILCL
jgi:hypothetical protein